MNLKEKIKKIVEYYDGNQYMALIPCLNLIQKEEGYISKERIKELSEILKIKQNKIIETLTFYHFFRMEKRDKILHICTNISCLLRGVDKILEYLKINKEKLKFEFEECECIGLCDHAPAGLFEFEPIKNLDIKKIEELNEKL